MRRGLRRAIRIDVSFPARRGRRSVRLSCRGRPAMSVGGALFPCDEAPPHVSSSCCRRPRRSAVITIRPVVAGSGAARGFTLIELLVVTAIIGVLVAIRPGGSAGRARPPARRCKNHMKQIGPAMHSYLRGTTPRFLDRLHDRDRGVGGPILLQLDSVGT